MLRPMAQVVDVLRWYRAAEHGEASWMAWTLLPLLPGPVPVLHMIRDPWQVIDSLTNRNSILRTSELPPKSMQSIRDTIDAYLPDVLTHDNRVDRGAAFVVGWNRLIAERVPDRAVFCADRLDKGSLRALLAHIHASADDGLIERALAEVPVNTNAGYTVIDTVGVTDPHVAEFIRQYADQHNISTVFTRRIKNQPDRQTPAELAEQMSPALLEKVNQFAEMYGYPTECRECVAA